MMAMKTAKIDFRYLSINEHFLLQLIIVFTVRQKSVYFQMSCTQLYFLVGYCAALQEDALFDFDCCFFFCSSRKSENDL